jgi:hypothetical protein
MRLWTWRAPHSDAHHQSNECSVYMQLGQISREYSVNCVQIAAQITLMLVCDAVPRVILLLPGATNMVANLLRVLEQSGGSAMDRPVMGSPHQLAALVIVACAFGCAQAFDCSHAQDEPRQKVLDAITVSMFLSAMNRHLVLHWDCCILDHSQQSVHHNFL